MPVPPSHDESFELLVAAFPKQKLDPKTIRVWADHLRDIPGDVFAEVVSLAIRTEDWPPGVAWMRRTAAEMMLALPSGPEALAQVEARIRWGQRNPDDRGEQPPVHDLARVALDSVGGFYVFRTSDRPDLLRNQFLKVFNEARDHAIRDGANRIDRVTPELQSPTRPALPVS